MAASAGRLDIYNMALGYIGVRTISSPNEQTPEAVQCGLYWDRARRTALRDFPWNFAARRVRLAQKKLPDAYAMQWRFAYALPDACLKVVHVHDGAHPNTPFRIVQDGGEVLILSRTGCAFADYTVDVEDISLWDELFVDAMVRKLACMIATPLLKNNPQKQEQLEQLYRLALPSAEGQDASEVELQKKRRDGWLEARCGWESQGGGLVIAVQNESAEDAAQRAAEKERQKTAAQIAALQGQVGSLETRLHEVEATDYPDIFDTGEDN